MNRVDQAHSMRPRLEELLEAQMRLRAHPDGNRHWIFEVERAIEEIQSGYPTSHSDTVELWAHAFLGRAA